MRARHIEAFHAIYTNGSISMAGRTLHVSQPSLQTLESVLAETLKS